MTGSKYDEIRAKFNEMLMDMVSDQYDYITMLDRNDEIPRLLAIKRIATLDKRYQELSALFTKLLRMAADEEAKNETVAKFLNKDKEDEDDE